MSFLSDFCYVVLYHVVRYRRDVVRDNLEKSFPEKSLEEIRGIEKQFYHDFGDLLEEGLKLRKLSTDDLKERITFTNPELIDGLYQKGRSLILAMAHSGNWEWYCNMMETMLPYQPYAVYKKISNRYVDRLVYRLRSNHSKNENLLIETKEAKEALAHLGDTPSAVLILGDQSPKGDANDYWTDFLHRDTCWYTGIEKLARKNDFGVVFVEMDRVARGHYAVTYKLVAENPRECEEGTILERYVRLVERFIQCHPDNWLWSHRRWKHSRK